MNTTPFDTQKVRLDLTLQLLETKERAATEKDVEALTDLAYQIRWIQNKLNFLGSPLYYERKAQS